MSSALKFAQLETKNTKVIYNGDGFESIEDEIFADYETAYNSRLNARIERSRYTQILHSSSIPLAIHGGSTAATRLLLILYAWSD